jgi:hypothetical protein
MTIAKSGRRRRALPVLAAVAAAAAAVALAVPAMAAPARPSGGVLPVGETGTLAQVPWKQVGPGWALAEYSTASGGEGVPVKAGADTLFLVDPAGGKYKMARWAQNTAPTKWALIAWSGDSQRALFVAGSGSAREQVHQLSLRTGRFTSFTLPAQVSALGYTRPDGLNIVADRGFNSSLTSKETLVRYNLRGQPQRTLATVRNLEGVAYRPDGTELAAGTEGGLDVIGNAGRVIRVLPVSGATFGCNAVRWWNTSTILASCAGKTGTWRLWLVPASGARPEPLTPVRHNNFDLGDFSAWQLSSGLYLNGYGGCGTLVIGRQPATGPETEVDVPGAPSSLIVTATSSKLMVERINGCQAGNSLVWFIPASRAMVVAIADHDHQWGVIAAIPYFVSGRY